MKFKKTRVKVEKKPTRKQLRKEKRVQKKVKKNEYYSKRGYKLNIPGQYVRCPNINNLTKSARKEIKPAQNDNVSVQENNGHLGLNLEQHRNKEKKEQKKLQKAMTSQRNKQLAIANEVEDRNIKKLEKQLKLNKRKSKGIPKSFAADGLDFLLEVCDEDGNKSAANAEQQFVDVNDDFMEDFELMSGNKKLKTVNQESDEDFFDEKHDDNTDEEESLVDENSDIDEEFSDSSEEDQNEEKKRKLVKDEASFTNHKKLKSKQSDSKSSDDEQISVRLSVDEDDFSDPEEGTESQMNNEVKHKGAMKVNPDGTWEDIYGRLRGNDGNLITKTDEKYIPPAVRAKLEAESSDDERVLIRLRRQLKGLVNRLAESNMHNIASQIEELYMNNSRNNMNDTLTNLILESIVSNVLSPERLLMEHVLLIAVIHANVGTEVGAHFLQSVAAKFDDHLNDYSPIEDKTLDNVVIILAQLYNFKLFDAKLMYEILHKLSENFIEKNIDCILHILRNIGFNLRKDDPLALKHLILELQKKGATISENIVNGTRVKFLLDILLAIKNNNVSKIPNYDNSYSEHLKKIMKGFIRKGNYVTQLNITLEDLLKAEEKGKWWVVGSAWAGNETQDKELGTKQSKTQSFSHKLLELARKQRMNTDTRRNIFCIIMSAEDYLDAFEKLLHLGLTNNQDREIIHVIVHCCLQENSYNPYYSFLAQKFCDYDRKFQMTIKYSIWDKLKALGEQSANQVSNLAKLLTHLFLERGLSISTLKIVQFSELDKLTLRFMRQVLLGILLNDDIEACIQVFEKVAQSDKLKMFRESLRLFIHHFLLKNVNSESIDEKQRSLLETRVKIVEKLLIMKDKAKF